MKRSSVAALAVLLAALLVAGCGGGSSSTGPSGGTTEGGPSKTATAPNAPAGSKVISCGGSAQLRATVVHCGTARTTMEQWESTGSCALHKDTSRNSCVVGGFRCQAANVDAGISVSCVSPEGDVAFIKPVG